MKISSSKRGPAAGAVTARTLPRWPLSLIASPAAVAIWSGWVGLGQICGFGIIHPLPGIADGFRLDTAITLPVGVEAYGAYALAAWLAPGVPATARVFARRSAVGALALGMAGQVLFHLLAAAHATRAPWPVVVFVSCLPVVTLGFGAALAHLLRSAPGALPVPGAVPVPGAAGLPAPGGVPGPDAVPGPGVPGSGVRAGADLLAAFAEELADGAPPSIRTIRARLRVGQDKARQIQAALAAYLAGAPAPRAPGGGAPAPAAGAVPGAGVPALAGSRP